LLPGTPAAVSYLAEHDANAPAGLPRVAGELCWAARGDARGSAAYRLRFGVLREGSHVQVPFGAQDLRAFDREGRATPLHPFPRMQVRPSWPLGGQVHLHPDRQPVTTYPPGPTPPKAQGPPVRRR